MTQDPELRLKELEAKVQKLTDLEEIRNLRHHYHEYMNEIKFAEIPNLFVEEGEIDFGHLGHVKGQSNLQSYFTQEVPVIVPFVKQFIHNHVINLQGYTARGFSYLEAKLIHKGESYLLAARYDDEYVKEKGQWKFKKMELTPYFMVPLREGWLQQAKA